MNLLPLTDSADGYRLPDGSLLPANDLARGRVARLGFRPEDVVVGGSEAFALDFEVIVAEPVGAESYLHGKAGGSNVIVRVHGRTAAQPGDRIRIGVPAGLLHAFGADGKRIEHGHVRTQQAQAVPA